MNHYELVSLDKANFKGYSQNFAYTTQRYYHVTRQNNGFSWSLCDYETAQYKSFEDTLFEDWMEDPVAFGIFEAGHLIAFIEGSIESWHQMFRITNIYVDEAHRHSGIGTLMMHRMMAFAKTLNVRCIILETQSCNIPAISFYKKNGFEIIAVNAIEYSNDDLLKDEVRFDLAYRLD